jgi:hypothetical protein
MMRTRWKAIGGVVIAGVLALPAWANAGAANIPRPGALNYVEGQASIGSQVLDSKSTGSVTLDSGQVLETQNGKAEILLTPGIFLRIDSSSAIRMDSPGLANTELTLERGRALVEVGEISKDNNVVIREDNGSARLLKKGLYEFDANAGEIRVFDGQAEVSANDMNVKVSGGHLVALNDPKLKSQGFDKKKSEDELYHWAKLRSSYLAEANIDAARVYVAGGPGWYGPGWYWDPWFSAYTWIPGAGVLWSPFGWGFYSPVAIYSAPVFVGGYYRHFSPGYRPLVVPRAGISQSFGAPRGFAGGSMRGGVGAGFHGGRR